MDPEVPQALRLQAILVGGIVIVHAKQQVYLLEDAQDTLVSRLVVGSLVAGECVQGNRPDGWKCWRLLPS